ncbi:hypothetical protein FPV67DRAFT_433044 [Lyophyllum atratum]|nr:hypothetical protein FPV67DRAFT_433044 [Lyophyllum atratum]
MNPSKPAPPRGRKPVSKPLATASTASTRARQAASTKAPTSEQITKPSTKSRSVNKPEPSSSNVKPAPAAVPPPIEEKVPRPAPTSDPLQVAGQLYPWLHMTSTLEACFQTAEEAAKKDLAARSQQLAEEESEISDERTRFEAERAADFYDELSTDIFAETAPHIMQTFLSHGDACTRVEAEALHLATHGASTPDEDAPLQVYNDMLDSLDVLHTEAEQLEASILALTATPESASPAGEGTKSDSSAREQILGVFAACLPVLRARISNLAMAQELIDGAQENLSIGLRMESLGLE